MPRRGQTHDRVIAVLDTGAGPLVNQQTLYVQLSRAREQAVVLTDNREQLVETLEANTGARLTALEALGEDGRGPGAGDDAAGEGGGLRGSRDRVPGRPARGAEAPGRGRGQPGLRLAEAEAAFEAARASAAEAERAFAALRAVGFGDRRALGDRLAAAGRALAAARGSHRRRRCRAGGGRGGGPRAAPGRGCGRGGEGGRGTRP